MFRLVYPAITAAGLLIESQVAAAHSPHEVSHLLQDRGYTAVEIVDQTPPNYMANACRDGISYHFHVDYYGEVTQRRQIGYCDEVGYGRGRHSLYGY